jgi:hypothetical protein
MTLIITAVTSERIFQASDRRLIGTSPATGANLTIENRNKIVCVRCKDAHFSIAFAGAATLGRKAKTKAVQAALDSGMTGPELTTDEWLVYLLTDIDASTKSLATIITFCRDRATQHIGRLNCSRREKRLSLVAAGFRGGEPFVISISNTEDLHGKTIATCQPNFKAFPYRLKKDTKRKDNVSIIVAGAEQSYTDVARNKTRGLIRKGLFHLANDEDIMQELANQIKAVAAVDLSVGKDCMVTAIYRDREIPILAHYIPERTSSMSFLPPYIGSGISTMHGYVHSGDEDSPSR